MESKSDEKYWEGLKDLETALRSRTDYSQNQRFQRLIARYQLFLGLLITLFAFFLGYGAYYLAGFFAILTFVIYWQYEREWDKSKQDTVKLWEKRDRTKTARELNRVKPSSKTQKASRIIKQQTDDETSAE